MIEPMNATPAARHKARHYAMQGVYQWQMSRAEPDEIFREFCDDNDMRHVDVDYFDELLRKVILQAESLDQSYTEFLQGHSLEELDPITLSLLRIASFELQHRIDIPFKVVISEAVGLAKKFGAAESHKFVNAVLDRAAAAWRVHEVRET
jgi:N utilization substance protein B